MRLSEWQSRSASADALAPKVLARAVEALTLLGADRDPDCWIFWGDDPAARYTVMAPAAVGLAVVNMRVNVPGEGPRAAGKVVRWPRVSVGELSVEIQGGHHLITFQVESQLMRGTEDEAAEVARFAGVILAAIDGRQAPADRAIELPGPVALEDAGGVGAR